MGWRKKSQPAQAEQAHAEPADERPVASPMRQHAVALVLLFLVTTGVFAWTVQLRSPWFGSISVDHRKHQWLTGCTLKWSRNWYRDGAFRDGFALFDNPASVEFPTLASREPYVSYGPGCVFPTYLVSCLSGREPTLAMVMGCGLATHFLIALLLGATAYVAIWQAGFSPRSALAFSLCAPCLELLLPAPFYFHQNVYAMDTAVLLLFAAAIFLETVRRSVPQGRWLTAIDVLLWRTLFFGYLTDWLMVFVGVTIYLKRLLLGEVPRSRISAFVKSSFAFWSSAMIAGALFVAQVTWLDGWKLLYTRFLLRSGIDDANSEFAKLTTSDYFNLFLPPAFGPYSQWVLAASLVFFLVLSVVQVICRFRGRAINPAITGLLVVMGLAFLPCLAQLRVFWQHSSHPFSTCKLAIPMSLAPFCLVPAAIALLVAARTSSLPNAARLNRFIRGSLQFLAIVLSLTWLSRMDSERVTWFPAATLYLQSLANAFAEAEIGDRDIVVSPHFEIFANPPHAVAHTMKRAYLCSTEDELSNLVRDIETPYGIVCMRVSGRWLEWRRWSVDSRDSLSKVLPSIVGFMKHDYGPADPEPDGAINFRKELPDFVRDFGFKLINTGKATEAEKLYASWTVADPDSADAHFWLGYALRTSDPKRSAECYRTAIKYEPGNFAARLNLGLLLKETDPDEAIRQFTIVTQLKPDMVEPHIWLGVLRAEAGQVEMAVRHWRRALELQPGHPEALKGLEWARANGG